MVSKPPRPRAPAGIAAAAVAAAEHFQPQSCLLPGNPPALLYTSCYNELAVTQASRFSSSPHSA